VPSRRSHGAVGPGGHRRPLGDAGVPAEQVELDDADPFVGRTRLVTDDRGHVVRVPIVRLDILPLPPPIIGNDWPTSVRTSG
jgi:hypothetical protein